MQITLPFWPLSRCLLLAATLATFGLSVAAQTTVLVNPGDLREQGRQGEFGAWRSVVEQALRKAGAASVAVQLSSDATRDLQTTRSRLMGAYLAPAHVVGSALRYGYLPVLGIDQPVQAVLVAPASSGITTLEQAKGKRLGRPLEDSLVTYLVRGELNAANTTFKRHFSKVYETRYQDALLTCLQLRQCDAVVVEKSLYERWVAAGEKLNLLMESKSAPGLSLAVREDSRLNLAVLREEVASAAGRQPELARWGKLASRTADDFAYVATLGYFTPRSLPGVQVTDAATVAKLLQAGARYIDTRTDAEFQAGHVPGAQLVPYGEKSAKDADYDDKLDQFNLSQLGSNKAQDLIFACNGAECWKSFKAARAAQAAGYTRVHWFRGGFPEWRSSGLPVATGP